MRRYLLSVLCAAFLVSLINAISGDGAGKGMRKLIGGIFLTLVVFRPLGGFDLPEFPLESYYAAADSAAEAGTAQAEIAQREFITDAFCAYILSKAAALGLEPDVRVMLNEDGLPASVTLTAAASPSEREALSGIVARELGLGKEAIEWIDPYQSSE